MYTITTNTAWRAISANATLAFQVTGPGSVHIAIATDVAPTSTGFIYAPGQGDRGATTTLFPSSSGNVVWARSSFGSEVTVS
jgi:hypothetical protein